MKVYKKRKGATSVLVIFMLIVLVALGSFAIVSSNSNYKLSKKTRLWNENFYQLDSLGEDFTACVDLSLLKAELDARNYIQNGLLSGGDFIPLQVRQDIVSRYNEAQNPESFLEDLFIRLYLHALTVYLPEVLANYPDVIITGLENDFLNFNDTGYIDKEILVEYIIAGESLDPENKSNLSVTLKATTPRYTIEVTGDTITGLREDASLKRYGIVRWEQWQTPFEYSEEHEAWQPEEIIEIVE